MVSDMSVRADLVICAYVECPSCQESIDLMDDYNDEGQVIRQACPDGVWSDEHEKFEVLNVECDNCGHEFDVKGMNW